MSETQNYDSQAILESQLILETAVWVVARDRDVRANHASADNVRERKEAMGRIDGLLDCMLELNLVEGDA